MAFVSGLGEDKTLVPLKFLLRHCILIALQFWMGVIVFFGVYFLKILPSSVLK